MNHTTKYSGNNLEQKIFGRTNVSEIDELIIFDHFGELREKWPKNAQKSLKLSKIAVFRLLDPKNDRKKLGRIASNRKPNFGRNGKKTIEET